MTSSNINVNAISSFTDNYIWAISNTTSSCIALVDPGDANVCIDYLEQNKLILNNILITHHHSDHVGGIPQLLSYCQQKCWPVTVYGPANENIPHCDIKLVEHDIITLEPQGITFKIIALPGHTSGHIAYVNDDILFCGDTLFSAGCGRLFEGTAEQMYQSLNKLSALPEKTNVYCAHEYTAANINFALTVDPENIELINYFNHVSDLRSKNMPTIPTNIGLEKQINPFLRCDENALKMSAEDYSNQSVDLGIATFAVIRQWKNVF